MRSSVRRSFPAALLLSLGLVAGGNSAAVAASTSANVFVVPSGGSSSCARLATPVAFAGAPASAKCSSVQLAVAAMSGGDSAIVQSGTYSNANINGVTKSPAVTVKVEAGGTANIGGTAWVGANGVILDGTEGANGQGWSTSSGFTVGSNGGAAVKNFTLTGAVIHDAGGGAVLYMTGCDNVTIRHLEIRDITGADGIQMANFSSQPMCTNVTFDDIYMHDFNATCGVDHQDGVQIRSGSNITFTNSRIIKLNNCGSQGFFANQEGDLGGSNTTLSNTVIAGINGNAINFSSKPPQRMINNTIDGGLNTCQPVTTTCNGVIMKNNILNTSCAGQALYHNRVQNSGDWANNVSTSNCGYSSQGDTVTSNFNAMFVSPGSPNYNYRLVANAFAVGKASKAEFIPVDFEGDTRDSAPDAGADEQGTGGTTPPPADTTAPSTSITSAPSGSTTSTSATLSFTGADDTSAAGSLSFECQLDSGAWAACTSPKAYSSLAVGSHTFSVRAKDAAGNVDGSPAAAAWTVASTAPADTTAPTTTLTAATSGSTTAMTASFSFTGADDTTAAGSLTFECSFDGAVFSACTSPKSYSGVAVGDHTFAVRAKDAAGNGDASPATSSWTVTAVTPPADTTAPTTSITSAPSGSSTATTASFAFIGADDTTAASALTFQCKLDAGAWGTCASPKAYNGLAVGSHTFSVRARDTAGNVDGSPSTASWTVTSPPPADTTAPDTAISSAPANPTTDTSASFVFNGSDDTTAAGALSFQCSLDNAAYAACGSPKAYTSLAVGAHHVRVRAKDQAGNVDASAASFSWTVAAPDTTAPETTITDGPPATTLSTTAQFAFKGSDEVTAEVALSYQCALDGGPWQYCTTPAMYAKLGLLGHTFAVRATDEAGNVDATPATVSWTVLGVSLPPVGLPDAPDSPTPGTGTTDPTDPAPTVPPAPPATTPTVTLSAPTAGATFTRALTVAATATAPAGAKISRVELYIDGTRVGRDTRAPYGATYRAPTRLAYGAHTVSARVYDLAGRVSSTAVTVTRVQSAAAAAKARKAVTEKRAGSAQLSSTSSAAGTDLAGAARSADTVVATLSPCTGSAGKARKVTLRAIGGQLSGHRNGRLCVVGLAPAAA